MYAIDRVRRRGETPGAMMEPEGSGGPAEGHNGSNHGSGKGAEITGIWQALRERGRVGGGEHGQ